MQLLVAGLIKDTFHLTDRHIPVTMYISCMFAHRYVQMKPETIPPKEQGKTCISNASLFMPRVLYLFLC
jgi:hypothetical protein